jgi:hypothetical protein
MELFENTVKLRGYLTSDPEVPTPEASVSDSHMLLILTLESGRENRQTGAWVVRTLNISVVCSGPDFAGITPDMQEGDYIEVDAEVDVLESNRPVVVGGERSVVIKEFQVIRALRVRKLELPQSGVDKGDDS